VGRYLINGRVIMAVVIAGSSVLAAGPDSAEGLTVADVVKGLSLDEARFSYSDEPPGKLRAVECPATIRDTTVKVRVRLELVYTPNLFSDKRAWDIERVRAATVQKVVIEPHVAGE